MTVWQRGLDWLILRGFSNFSNAIFESIPTHTHIVWLEQHKIMCKLACKVRLEVTEGMDDVMVLSTKPEDHYRLYDEQIYCPLLLWKPISCGFHS